MSSARKHLFSGNLGEFDLPALLETFSLGRQRIGVEMLDPNGRVVGRIVVKGGKILSATAGPKNGIEALRALLSQDAQSSFRAFNEIAPSTPTSPIASVADLPRLRGPRSGLVPAVSRIRVMEATLDDFDLATLMQVASASRQYLAIEVAKGDSELVGTVCLKSGHVVAAQAGDEQGVAAIAKLVDLRDEVHFTVFRMLKNVELGTSLGTVTDVLVQAFDPKRVSKRVSVPAPPSRGYRPASVPPPASIARIAVMEGSLGEIDVASLLQVVSSSRQHTEIDILDPDGNVIGGVGVKAGKVLVARAGALEGISAVGRLLESPPQFTFVVRRRSSGGNLSSPLGDVDEVLLRASEASRSGALLESVLSAAAAAPAEIEEDTSVMNAPLAPAPAPAPAPAVAQESDRRAPAPAAPPTGWVPVMEGLLSEFDIANVLEVVGTSRQFTTVEVRARSGELVGSVQLKGGKLLSATSGTARGVDAVSALLTSTVAYKFDALRATHGVDVTQVVGSIRDVLRQATKSAAAPAPAVAPVAPVAPAAKAASSASPLAAPARQAVRGSRARAETATTMERVAIGIAAAAIVVAAGIALYGRQAATPAAARDPSSTPRTVTARETPMRTTSPVTTATAIAPAAPAAPTPVAPVAPVAPEAPANGAVVSEAARTPSAAVFAAQTRLKARGFDPGPIDGVAGPRTAAAVKAFQAANRLPADGILDTETRDALNR